MHYLPTLHTERLLLRPFSKADAPAVQLLAGNKKVSATTLNIPYPYPDGLAAEWIATHEEDFFQHRSLILAVCLKPELMLIGAIGLMINRKHDHAEMGYWIGEPYWNRGYCTETCRAIISFGFSELKLNKIFAHYFIHNVSSGKVLQKSGMKRESHLRSHVRHQGRYLDLVGYGILKDEYLQ